jgi:hypothetical protein
MARSMQIHGDGIGRFVLPDAGVDGTAIAEAHA